MIWKKLFIFGCVVLSALFSPAGHRDVAEILGATHMNPLYSFTQKPVLEEGANVLRHMGSRAIKLWYGPDYKTNYPQHHDWPTVSNITALAQTEYFQTMFGDPDFRTYSLELATFDYHKSWVNGLVNYEYNSIYNEIYEFTAYLLTRYNNSGKTFIIQNWEGDNNLGQDASAVKVQGMIDWLNCRQDAITAAMADSASSNVWVYGASECNKVGQPDFSGPRCITDVFPHLHMDLYSYSDWYTRYEEDLLLEDLSNIKRYAPDSPTFGYENVMLGEFGLNRTPVVNGEAGNLLSSQTEFEIGMDAGARFAFYWCVYDTNTNKSHGMVLNAEYAGQFGLPVDHTGRYFSRTHTYFKTNSLTLDVFEDLAADFSECAGSSNLMVKNDVLDEFDNDPSRFVRINKTQPGVLDYAFDRDVRRLAVMGYEQLGKVTTVTVSASKTGASGSYVDIPLRKVVNDVYSGNTFRRMLHKNVDTIPSGYRYFKVAVDSNVQQSPQLGSIRFYYERPPIVQTIQFGGKAVQLADTNHQAQVGADELVQFNGADSWGGAVGLNGNLNGGNVGTFITSPSTGLKLTTTLASSNTVVNSNTGVIGIQGGDNAKFDAALGEQWGFAFDQTVVLKQLLVAAVNDDSEEATATINGVDFSFTRIHVNSTVSGWNVNRFIYTFDPPLQLASGTEVLFRSTSGQIGLEGVVVQAGAMATPYDLWVKTKGLAGTGGDWFADPDGDGADNLAEFALGGDPLAADAKTIFPTLGKSGTESFQTLEYSYRRRIGEPGLIYQVEQSDSLVSNVWKYVTNSPAVSVIDANFEEVVCPVAVDEPHQFYRLQIKERSD